MSRLLILFCALIIGFMSAECWEDAEVPELVPTEDEGIKTVSGAKCLCSWVDKARGKVFGACSSMGQTGEWHTPQCAIDIDGIGNPVYEECAKYENCPSHTMIANRRCVPFSYGGVSYGSGECSFQYAGNYEGKNCPWCAIQSGHTDEELDNSEAGDLWDYCSCCRAETCDEPPAGLAPPGDSGGDDLVSRVEALEAFIDSVKEFCPPEQNGIQVAFDAKCILGAIGGTSPAGCIPMAIPVCRYCGTDSVGDITLLPC